MNQPQPDAEADRYLRLVAKEQRGKLTAYLGAAPGVGKTYRMLQDGARRQGEGIDVLVGIVETHGRRETAALVAPLELLPRLAVTHEGHALGEFDLDAALARRPQLILVDELAHTNAPGSRHTKRWQDVAELLGAGIDVATTINIQHIESLNDLVAGFTHIRVRETVPDSILDDAELVVIDLPPAALIERLNAGKVYLPETAGRALTNFFTPAKLGGLRELALRFAARSVDRRLTEQRVNDGDAPGPSVGERLVVAVSPGKGGEQLVRHAKRMADLLDAPWTAVLVESARARAAGGSQREQLAANLALAASLGASLMTIAADKIGEALIEQARNLGASQVVIGKSRRSRWFEFWHGSIAQDVIRQAGEITVHLVPLAHADEKLQRPDDPHSQLGNILAFGSVALTVGVLTLLRRWLPADAIDLLLLLPVILSASLLRQRAGLWAAMWAALAYNYFFVPPLYTLTIAAPSNLATFAVLALVAIVVSSFASRVRRQAETSAGVARLNAALARFAGIVGSVSGKDDTAVAACREIEGLLDVRAIIAACEEPGKVAVRGNAEAVQLDMIDEAAARWAIEHGMPTGRDTGTLNASDWQFHPLKTSRGTMGALGVARPSQGRVIRPDDLPLLASLVDQTALAHERLLLEAQARNVDLLRERDNLRGALLGSIAHDLRTPLTTVIAATEAIPAAGDHAEIVHLARSEARRLARFLNDLLEASRIEHGSIEPRWESVDMTDVIAAVLRDLRQDRQGSRVVTRIDSDCPLVRSDPLLLRHVLINLIDNALKFSAPEAPVEIELSGQVGAVVCRVLDIGPGLPADNSALFERFHRLEGSDRVGGSGLGLWIAKNFVEAVGGTITAANRPGGGAVFELELPVAIGIADGEGAEGA